MSISAQLLYRNVERFRGGLVFQVDRLVCDLILGLRVITKKKKEPGSSEAAFGHSNPSIHTLRGPGQARLGREQMSFLQT